MPPYLSWRSGRPLCYVKGGEKNGSILHVNEGDDAPEVDESSPPEAEDIMAELKPLKLTPREKAKAVADILKALRKKIEPLDDDLCKIYKKFLPEDKPKKGLQEIKLSSGKFVLIPPKTIEEGKSKRECHYIFGPSGAGKSFKIAAIGKEYNKLYKSEDRPIWVFSQLDDDKDSLDKLGLTNRIVIDDKLVTDPLPISMFAKSLVVFDDCDGLTGKIKAAVDTIMNNILTTGRHFDISCICANHLGMDHKNTRLQLSEAHWMTIFTGSCSASQINYFLSKYVGCDKEEIKRIKKLGGRSVSILRQYPQVVVGETKAFVLHSGDDSDSDSDKKPAKKIKDI